MFLQSDIKYFTEGISAAGNNKHIVSTMARNIFQGQAPTSAQSGVMDSWNAEIEGVYGLLSALSQPDELASWF